jgi:DNA gyrase subunit A
MSKQDQNEETFQHIDIEREMQDSFLEYAMSVIVSRALPDVRDGLKPVHRRVLYSMWDSGIRPGTPYRKCSRVVGDVVGWFHPHAPEAVYDSLVRLGQDFASRHPLVDPQGNFGTVDDPPAAMRYCVVGETRIATPLGTTRIDSLADDVAPESDTSVDVKILDRRANLQVASKLFHSGTHETFAVRTREGFEITGTANHPVLTIQRVGDVPVLIWKTIGELADGDRVAIARRYAPTDGSSGLRHDEAMLLGAWVSEGFVSDGRAGFNNTDGWFFTVVRDAYRDIVGGRFYESERQLPSGATIFELDVHNLDALNESILGEFVGVRSADKYIPDSVWNASTAVKASFLAALFEGDGSSSNLGRNTIQIAYSTRSDRLARDVQNLLLEFGVVGRLCRYDRGEIKVVISNRRDARLFVERIGFLGAKIDKLDRELEHIPLDSSALSRDEIPFIAEFVRNRIHGTDREWLRKHNVDRVERWDHRRDEIRRHVSDADVLAIVDQIVEHGFYYATVDEIVSRGEREVFSIKVESEDHSFIGNGFVNHNTEARLAKLAAHMLDGIDEDTVDFRDNYSGEREEPTALPSRFPNLLVNGSTGIAVGMATNMAPHNLAEVVDAVLYALDHPEATVEDLMEFVKGPDFPTGAYIVGNKGVHDALMTGRGSIRMRSVTDVVEIRKNRIAIVVSEIPYQVSRDRIMSKIAELVNSKVLTGISDVRDETDRQGTRLVIELKRDANPQVVLNMLFKHTQLEDTFAVNNVALVDGVPRTLNLAQLVHHYIAHQLEVIERRSRFRLAKAEARAHILRGLLIALDNIDEVVQIIRSSQNVEEARTSLMERFSFSEVQANHILDMPLRRLTALETNKLRDELSDLEATIEYLESLLADEALRRALIGTEMAEIRDKFADNRRSRIVPDSGEMSLEDLIADEELVVSVSSAGYVKSVIAKAYRTQARGGRGIKGAAVREDDVIEHLLHTSAHAYLLFFTNRGKVYRVRAHEIPRKDRTAKGVLIQSVLPLEPDEVIEAVIDTRDYETNRYLVMFTRSGLVKKSKFADYDSRNQVLVAIKLVDDDEVVAVRQTKGESDLMMFTKNGLGIRFSESDVRPTGRASQGVRGIRLREGDEVVSAAVADEADEVLILTAGGYGKRVKMDEFRVQKRGGVGVIAMKTTRVRGPVAAARAVSAGDEIVVTSSDGIVMRAEAKSISRQKRPSTGVKVMNLDDGAVLSALAIAQTEVE